ncbi:CLUMA_CG002870, isoform A [Clunio marinus]|uniref:CLUMA_CG002870, isoform A n=1 Tax=Clunio marinus TaxID=568069 RepID=A0A1J1HM66_9DIPT|nr:CLUMA_CG002870, isoform A [Clunio marinus]
MKMCLVIPHIDCLSSRVNVNIHSNFPNLLLSGISELLIISDVYIHLTGFLDYETLFSQGKDVSFNP